MGAEKYGENSWRTLPDYWKRYKAALLRHLTAIDNGELIDAESGLPHIDHVLCNAVFLSWGHHHGKQIDTEASPIFKHRSQMYGLNTMRDNINKVLKDEKQTNDEGNNQISG